MTITTAYGNDFAAWVATHVRDQVLAERLAIVNPLDFPTLEELREELLGTIHDHLLHRSSVPRVEVGKYFRQQSHVVEVASGATATTLEEFRQGLAAVDASAIYFHMVEARSGWGVARETSRSGCATPSSCHSSRIGSSASTRS